jgi:hypothetical protein
MRIIAVLFLVVACARLAAADAVSCQKAIAKQYAGLVKKTLKDTAKCLDKDNAGTLAGPCPDAVTAAKLSILQTKIESKVAAACTMADASALGFGATCGLDGPGSAAESNCAALPVTSSAELAACVSCWKKAQASEALANLYASHAQELCGGTLGAGSTVCARLDCTTPTPDQRDLGTGGEYDCQRAIGKGGVKHLLARLKAIEKCALVAGTTAAGCALDDKVELALAKADLKFETAVANKCGGRTPQAALPFCCKTTGNMCMLAADRDACVLAGGQVQENKTCSVGSCQNAPGGQKLTWWETCPRANACAGSSVSSMNDLTECYEDTSAEIVSELLCFQFPRNGHSDFPCPASASGAFID